MKCQCFVLLGLFLLFSFHSSEGAGGSTKWAYTGQYGVDKWATNFPDYCSGSKQSPINLDYAATSYDSDLKDNPFVFTDYDTTDGITWELSNNGHSIVVGYTGANPKVTGGKLGGTFKVLQFHFHWGQVSSRGSEHTLNKKAFPMELHIVHQNEKYPNVSEAKKHSDGLAVLGYFFQTQAADNAIMQQIVDKLRDIVYPGTKTAMTPFALDNVISGTKDFFRYDGGLTTPGCNEAVIWTVFKHPILISENQMNKIRSLFDSDNQTMVDNYRPVQPLNGRMIRASFMDDDFSGTATHVVSSILALAASLLLSIGLRFC